jgi:23S rRNA pseudouridine2605 synthase
MERLQKILSARGVCSRRQAEALIEAGRVTCNGTVCKLGDSADADKDLILVDGAPLPSAGKRVYIMLHKPRGYVTTLKDEKGRKDAAQLVADCGTRVYPVGRLDMDSEGLLLFTNDGAWANKLMHPSHEVEKVYRVTVTGYTPEGLEKLEKPVELDGYRIKAPGVRMVERFGNKTCLEVTIHEGRNRQVRRMCAKAGLTVLRLKRIREGKVELDRMLKPGTWRPLTEEEISWLKLD